VPRPFTAPERALLASQRFHVYAALEVVNALGAWQDITSWLLRAEWGSALDQSVGQATFVLRRESMTADGPRSLAPLIGASALNDGGALIDYRSLRLRTAVVSPGASPAGAWRTVFTGKTNRIDTSLDSTQLTLGALDLMARLADAQVEAPTVYGTEEGRAVQLVMQDIQDEWAPGFPAIFVADDPLWQVTEYEQTPQSVLEAQRTLALQIGYDYRGRFTGADSFQPVFRAPERVAPLVDVAFAASEYTGVPRLGGSDDDIRNVVTVRFVDLDGATQDVTEEDAESIAAYGRRFMAIGFSASHNIRTEEEARRLAQAAVSDLAWPEVDQEVRTLYFWPAEIGDFYEFAPNGVLYDSAQQMAVVGYSHVLEAGRATTTLRGRSRPRRPPRRCGWRTSASCAARTRPSPTAGTTAPSPRARGKSGSTRPPCPPRARPCGGRRRTRRPPCASRPTRASSRSRSRRSGR
jgi:hypothetical protein